MTRKGQCKRRQLLGLDQDDVLGLEEDRLTGRDLLVHGQLQGIPMREAAQRRCASERADVAGREARRHERIARVRVVCEDDAPGASSDNCLGLGGGAAKRRGTTERADVADGEARRHKRIARFLRKTSTSSR
eukprot:366089-Chlamydomonas_euryale.AAC.8